MTWESTFWVVEKAWEWREEYIDRWWTMSEQEFQQWWREHLETYGLGTFIHGVDELKTGNPKPLCEYLRSDYPIAAVERQALADLLDGGSSVSDEQASKGLSQLEDDVSPSRRRAVKTRNARAKPKVKISPKGSSGRPRETETKKLAGLCDRLFRIWKDHNKKNQLDDWNHRGEMKDRIVEYVLKKHGLYNQKSREELRTMFDRGRQRYGSYDLWTEPISGVRVKDRNLRQNKA